jgi:hypothetical protein
MSCPGTTCIIRFQRITANHASVENLAAGGDIQCRVSFSRVLADGLLACVPFSVVVWTTFLSKPRLWLHSLPPDIQAMAPPKTEGERRLTAWMGTLVLLCFFGVPAALTWRLHDAMPGGLSFAQALAHLYGVWMVVNLWDLVLIDWPYTYLVNPARPPIPGTAGARGYKDYGFHARAFLTASLFSLAIIVPAALVISWLPHH